jgi:Fe-S-cluster containining protein
VFSKLERAFHGQPRATPPWYAGTVPLRAAPHRGAPLRPFREIPTWLTQLRTPHASGCGAKTFPRDTPRTREEFDYVRWYLLHEQATVFVDEGTWYLLVHTRCRHLQPDNRCGIYETRPQICRDYSTDNCEFDDEACYEQYFETPEQLEEYMEAVLPPSSGSIRSPRPALLPVLG